MKLKFWIHKNGFRSPTEQQLARWETDGGNYSEVQDAVLFEGRLYSSQAELTKARLIDRAKRFANYVHAKLPASVTSTQRQGLARP